MLTPSTTPAAYCCSHLAEARALRHLLADRESELVGLKGPCTNRRCRLHYAHSGPCAQRDRWPDS
jgi:hypothetical protein